MSRKPSNEDLVTAFQVQVSQSAIGIGNPDLYQKAHKALLARLRALEPPFHVDDTVRIKKDEVAMDNIGEQYSSNEPPFRVTRVYYEYSRAGNEGWYFESHIHKQTFDAAKFEKVVKESATS